MARIRLESSIYLIDLSRNFGTRPIVRQLGCSFLKARDCRAADIAIFIPFIKKHLVGPAAS